MLIAFLMLLFSFFNPSAQAEIAELRIADSKGDWGYPNPFRHYPRGPGYLRMSWVFDTLIWKDENGYIPALAEKWSFDPDSLAFTFELNSKAVWHDGKALTAEDIVFTIDYFKKHPYRWITVENIDRAEASGRNSVKIYLAKPYAPFLSDIGGTMPILPEHIWKAVDKPETYDEADAFIGSGPYMFRDFNRAQGTYLFEAFDDYYQGRPKADRLIYVKTGKALVSLMSGQVDLAGIQPEMAVPLKKKGLVIIKNEAGWNKKLMINHRKAPFNDRRFRQAVAFAIDRKEIIDKAHRGFGRPASFGLLSADHEMYNPDTPDYPHDPSKAMELIESLGYEKDLEGFYGKDGSTLKIELLVSPITVAGQNVLDRDGEIMERQLEAVGIQVDLVNMEQATTDSLVRNWDFDLVLSGHGGIAGDPRILAEMISSKYGAGSVNSTRYDANQELNMLLEAQMTEMDNTRRREIVFRIQKLYALDLPAVSLYYPPGMAAYNPEKRIEWFYTRGGISKGIPIPQNKMSLIR
ncbi:MAG: ABC transporter substrate-binding protein [Desulfatiglandaceae bacterium]